VPRLPTAILSVSLVIVASLSLMTGMILDTVSRGRREMRMLAYLHYLPFDVTNLAEGTAS
jgi:hypothetical protein